MTPTVPTISFKEWYEFNKPFLFNADVDLHLYDTFIPEKSEVYNEVMSTIMPYNTALKYFGDAYMIKIRSIGCGGRGICIILLDKNYANIEEA